MTLLVFYVLQQKKKWKFMEINFFKMFSGVFFMFLYKLQK